MATKKLIGRVKAQVDGNTLRSKNGASINPGGTVREAKPNDQGGVDFMEVEIKPSEVTLTLLVDNAYSSEEINGWEGVTLTYDGDNGKKWSIADAFVTEPPTISEGEAEITFMGPPAVEVA